MTLRLIYRISKRFLVLLNFCISLILLETSAMANSSSSDSLKNAYASAKDYLSKQQLSTQLSRSLSKANQILPSVESSPDEAQYYDDPDAMASNAIDQMNRPQTAENAIRDTTVYASSVSSDVNFPQSAFSTEIQKNADGIVNGTYENCGKENVTRIEREEKICQSTLPFSLSCYKNLQASLENEIDSSVFVVSLPENIHLKDSKSGFITMPVSSGIVTALDFHLVNYHKWQCDGFYEFQLNGITVGTYANYCGVKKRHLHFSDDNLRIPFENGIVSVALLGHRGELSGVISGTLSFKAQSAKVKKTWGKSSCSTIPASCVLKENRCLDHADRSIDGTLVTADCWKMKLLYHCSSIAENTCANSIKADCLLESKQCLKTVSGTCVQERQTWSCPHPVVIGHRLQCGQPLYCEDGQCEPNQSESNTQFGESATELKAASLIGEDIRSQQIDAKAVSQDLRIFSGRVATCRDVTLGTMNCCRDDGWAKGIVMQCSQGEQQLGQAKEQGGLVLWVGRYCSHRTLGVCLEYKQSYCIFPSRIARDIQQDGRKKQLHRDFGSAASPDCSGLSLSELQRLDFQQIDFSNAIESVIDQSAIPASSDLQKQIEQQVVKKVAVSLNTSSIENKPINWSNN